MMAATWTKTHRT